MRAISIGLTSLLIAGSLLAAPLALADDDKKGKSENRGGNKKSFEFRLPFINIGTTTATLQEQIRALRETLNALKAQREALDDDDDDDTIASSTKAMRDALKVQIKETKAEVKETKRELRFLRSLSRGMSGDDVRDLQELLAQDSSIFPAHLITGFFGPKTEEALRKFQKKFGIEAIGIFGPKTQARLLSLFVGRELPAGIIARLGLATSSTTPGAGVVTVCHKPAGVSPQTLVIGVPALGAHLAHGDTVGICLPGGSTGTTTPPADTTAPSLSALSASSASTSAQVMWATNEAATSKVWYGTTSPLTLGSPTANASNSALVTSHTLALTGLTASTTYQYVAESSDVTGNAATSSQQSFTTPQ